MKKKWKILSAVMAAICLCGCGFTASVRAEEAEDVFVQQEIRSYEGIYLEVTGRPPDNYRKVGVVLDEPVAVGENKFLSVAFRNLANANIPFSVTVEDGQGNRLHTGFEGNENNYKTHYYIPENTQELRAVKEYYGCVNMKSDVRGGELLVDLSAMTQTGKAVTQIEKVFIGLPAAYNVGEKIELLALSLADGMDFTYAEDTGFSAEEEDILAALTRTELYDFTAIATHAEFEDLCARYRILKCNNDNAVTKTFENYVSIGKSEFAKGVALEGKCEEGIKFSLKQDGTYLSANQADTNYAADKFGYIRLANCSDNPFSVNDALALKMSAIYKNSAFRIIVVEEDGEAWQAGAASGQYVFARDADNVEYMQTYYNCIWPDKKEGTLTIPYSAMKFLSAGSVALQNTEQDKKLTSIAQVYLAMDMAESSKDAPLRKLAFAALADVDFAARKITPIADLTAYTVAESKEKVADANFFAADKSVVTKPCSTNAVSNANWVLGRATLQELASKAELQNKYIGSVKVLEQFAIEDKNYTAEQKDEIIGGFYATYGEVSTLACGALGDGTPALEWKIGNYANDYQNVSGGYCGLTVDPSADADRWADWRGANGIILRLKNPQPREVSFNIAFQQRLNGETVSYRMNYNNAAVYALDAVTGEEFSFRTGAVSSFSSGPAIYIPAQFDGWLCLDFFSFGKYSAAGPVAIDFTNDVTAIKITSYMLDNSDASILFGLIGLYYERFTVDWSFGGEHKTIADCLQGGAHV